MNWRADYNNTTNHLHITNERRPIEIALRVLGGLCWLSLPFVLIGFLSRSSFESRAEFSNHFELMIQVMFLAFVAGGSCYVASSSLAKSFRRQLTLDYNSAVQSVQVHSKRG